MLKLKKVLVIDDDEAVRISLAMHFEDLGYEVYEAASGEEALQLIVDIEPDAAIVDLRLPNMDGIETIRSIKCGGRSCVYIIYTGSVEVEVPQEILDMPCVSKTIFFKPVDDLNLISDEAERLFASYYSSK